MAAAAPSTKVINACTFRRVCRSTRLQWTGALAHGRRDEPIIQGTCPHSSGTCCMDLIKNIIELMLQHFLFLVLIGIKFQAQVAGPGRLQAAGRHWGHLYIHSNNRDELTCTRVPCHRLSLIHKAFHILLFYSLHRWFSAEYSPPKRGLFDKNYTHVWAWNILGSHN